jgi:hypothetical protein
LWRALLTAATLWADKVCCQVCTLWTLCFAGFCFYLSAVNEATLWADQVCCQACTFWMLCFAGFRTFRARTFSSVWGVLCYRAALIQWLLCPALPVSCYPHPTFVVSLPASTRLHSSSLFVTLQGHIVAHQQLWLPLESSALGGPAPPSEGVADIPSAPAGEATPSVTIRGDGFTVEVRSSGV